MLPLGVYPDQEAKVMRNIGRCSRLASPLVGTVLALAVAMTAGCLDRTPRQAEASGARGLRPRPVPEKSAGVFVGVSEFTRDRELQEIPFAADDAVDLAYLLALEAELLPPGRVVLLLSGVPQKSASRSRLATLRGAGAQLSPATGDDIKRQVRRQARAVGVNGLFVLGLATHGFSDGDVHYLMGSDSSLDTIRRSGVKTRKLLESARVARAYRLMFVDACHGPLPNGPNRGSEEADPRFAMPDLSEVGASGRGQVIFSAALPGGYAYDDNQRRNGVFTAALIDGLRCQGQADPGLITPPELHSFVNDAVERWTALYRNDAALMGTAIYVAGNGMHLPLGRCEPTALVRDEPDRPPAVVTATATPEPATPPPPLPSPAGPEPAITSPPPKTRLGVGAGATYCIGGDCLMVQVTGTVPEGYHPFLAVQPHSGSTIWIQRPPSRSLVPNAFRGVVQLGNGNLGSEEWFSIYVLASQDRSRFATNQTLSLFPDDCLVSPPTDVFRAR